MITNDKITNAKILVTGPSGQIAFPLCQALAQHNEVWGIGRFASAAVRARVDAIGVTTRAVDLATGDFNDLPDDFDYLIHLASYMAPGLDYDQALRVNAEGTGLLLQHCASVRAALVMSTTTVYKAHSDPWHHYLETDPIGDASLPYTPTYSISKISEEAVARFCARAFDIPVVIARMNSAYGNNGGLPAVHLAQIMAGETVSLRNDPAPYSPIHDDDIAAQLEAIVSMASTPATIVNWGGDHPVTAQQWCAFFGEISGQDVRIALNPVPGAQLGAAQDVSKRLAVTGPCTVDWMDGMRRMYEHRYPDGVDTAHRQGPLAMTPDSARD